jgi:hypothetical protein
MLLMEKLNKNTTLDTVYYSIRTSGEGITVDFRRKVVLFKMLVFIGCKLIVFFALKKI